MTDDRRPTTDDSAPTNVRRSRKARPPEAQPAPSSTMVRRHWLERLSKSFKIAGVVTLVAAFLSIFFVSQRPAQVIAVAPAPIQTFLPAIIPFPTLTPTVTPTPLPPLIALLAGHSGGIDTGAVCPDGLREVDITKDVAARAKTMLDARGYRVDILAEFDKRLDASKRDYAPQAFLAIHVDSCVYYASGYKVARADNSVVPQVDDRLVQCVTSTYGAATQLSLHPGSITTDMTHYHALEEINPQTPGAIIELGFLGSDKSILVNKRDVLALGIADGIDEFLRGSSCQ